MSDFFFMATQSFVISSRDGHEIVYNIIYINLKVQVLYNILSAEFVAINVIVISQQT